MNICLQPTELWGLYGLHVGTASSFEGRLLAPRPLLLGLAQQLLEFGLKVENSGDNT